MRRLAKAPPGARGSARPARGSGVRGKGASVRVQPDRLEGQAGRPDTHWDTTLIWFMRLVALVWIAKGLVAWAVILGAAPDFATFETERVGRQVAIAYFGIVDLMAAVGLWLASPWGGVIWLLAATSYLVLGIALPTLVPSSLLVIAGGAILIAAYLALSWLAAQEAR